MLTNLKRKLTDHSVPAIGLGCMNLSHAYGQPPTAEEAIKVLHRALDLGVVHFDSAALYGFGRNEELIGPVLRPFREQILLTSKCGLTGVDSKRVIDGRPASLKKTCETSLRNLHTDVIDLYYLHRVDKQVPVEDSIGALKDLVEEGKIKHIGLSEVSAATLRKAHAIHPVAAVQSEYSLWSRNAELGVLAACDELGIAYVAFSPLGRGFLADPDLNPQAFVKKDIRRGMPRFQQPHFSRNMELRSRYCRIAHEADCTPAQLALAWLLHKAPHIHVIPGTTSSDHLEENMQAGSVLLDKTTIETLDHLINSATISGPRYNTATQADIDTEEFGIIDKRQQLS